MHFEISPDSDIALVRQVLTQAELELLGLFKITPRRAPSVSAPTGDLDQDRLLYELARRPRLLDAVARTTGAEIALWRHSLGAARDLQTRLLEVGEGPRVTAITAVCPATEAITVKLLLDSQKMRAHGTSIVPRGRRYGNGDEPAEFPSPVPEVKPGTDWHTVQLHGGDALVLPLGIQWFFEAGSTANVMLQYFGGAHDPTPGAIRPPAFAVRGSVHSVFAFDIRRPPPKSAHQSNAVAASIFPLTSAGSAILTGRSDVLNALTVSIVTNAMAKAAPPSPLRELLLVALEDIQIGADGLTLRAGEALYSPSGQSMALDLMPHGPGRALRLDWIGAPQGYADVLPAGRPPNRSASRSTTYLSKLCADTLVLTPAERPASQRGPGDVFAVLVDGTLRVAGSEIVAPALLVIPAGACLDMECAAAGKATLTIVEMTGQVRQLAAAPDPDLERNGGSEAPPVYFCIPLIAKSRAGDWASICRHLAATIGSIYAQTDRNWRIIVVGDDLPSLTAKLDERYTFIRMVGSGNLSDLAGMNRDAGHKRYIAETEVAARGGGFVMQTDADDLIERTLVDFVRRNNHPFGYVIGRGIVFDFARQRAAAVPFTAGPDIVFDQFCATCCVVRLPAGSAGAGRDAQMLVAMLWTGHDQLRETFYLAGRPLMPIPFPAAAYLRFTGQNTSVDNKNDPQKWLVEAMAGSALALDNDLIRAFSFRPLLRSLT